MGSEVELALEYRVDNIKFSKQSALFFPSKYYERRSMENKFIPAGQDTFYGLRFGIEYVIDLEYLRAEGKTAKTRSLPDKTRALLNRKKDIDD